MLDSLEDGDRSGKGEVPAAADAVHRWKVSNDVSEPRPEYTHNSCLAVKVARERLILLLMNYYGRKEQKMYIE
jgi:hypothetical protein